MLDEEGNVAETDQDSRKSKRTTRGSQTDDKPSKSGETNPPINIEAKLAEMNRNVYLALAGIKDIEELKEKQHILEKDNSDLRGSLEFAHNSIVTLTERANGQQKTLSTAVHPTKSCSCHGKRNLLNKARNSQ